MRNLWIVVCLLANLSWGQVTPGIQTQGAPPSAAVGDDDDDDKPQSAAMSAASIPGSAPVLTIKGVCDPPKSKTFAARQGEERRSASSRAPKAACQTVVTRSEFEKLANAISPTMTLEVKRQLATAYPRLLAMAHNAERIGLDKTSRVAELQRFSRLQILAQEMVREIQEESAKISEKDIVDYYHHNPAEFEQATIERIFIPTRKRTDPPPKDKADESAMKAQQKEAEDAMTKEADDLRDRAVAGEDFNKLQEEAFTAAGIKTSASARNLDKMGRTSLPPAHQMVFDLKPGEVSQVINDASGHYIYKVDSKDVQPLDAVKIEIKNKLQGQKTQDAMKKIQDSFTSNMNDAYFGVNPAPAPGKTEPAETGNTPPSQ